jgi:hypothetical protein
VRQRSCNAGEPIANAPKKHALLVGGVNQTFTARVGDADVAGLRNVVSAGAPFLEVPSMGARGKRRARGKQDKRHSSDHCFHFRSPLFEPKRAPYLKFAGPEIMRRSLTRAFSKTDYSRHAGLAITTVAGGRSHSRNTDGLIDVFYLRIIGGISPTVAFIRGGNSEGDD